MLNWVRLDSEQPLTSQIQNLLGMSSMILSLSKSSSILRNIPLSVIDSKLMNASINVEVYFQIKHTVSAILSYIGSHFGLINRDIQLYTLTSKEF